METPNQLLERLDRLGEQRVRHLIARKHFEPKKVPLVEGWLERQEQARIAAMPDPDAEAKKAQEQAREAMAKARKASEAAAKADANAGKAQRLAIIATAVGSAAVLVSVLALFALAIN
jgi:hypothetical protein